MRIGAGTWSARASAFAVGVLALFPIGLLLVYSLSRSWFWPALLPSHWDLHAWNYVFSNDSGIADSLAASIAIALAVTVIAIAISLPAARAIAWNEFRGKRTTLFLLLLPIFAPPLASAMGLHSAFLRLGLAETAAGVILVHLIQAVPYSILMLAGSHSRFDPALEEQARTLGASTSEILRRVTLPSLAPGVAAAASFAFLISWSQYLLTLLIGGGRVLTLPMTLVAFQQGGDEAIAAAVSLVFILPAFALFLAVARYLRYDI